MRGLALALSAVAALACGQATAQPAPVMFRYMGPISCGSWPKDEPHTRPGKALMLNYVLGYLSRASVAHKRDLLAHVDPASVSAWMDNYCQTHPLDTILRGADVLEEELFVRAAPTSGR
jgi:hypothetical protein